MKMLKMFTTRRLIVLVLLVFMLTLTGQDCPGSDPFANLVIPLEDDNGTRVGTLTIDEDGLQVLDNSGNVVSVIDQNGSTHNKPETFKKIIVPLRGRSQYGKTTQK